MSNERSTATPLRSGVALALTCAALLGFGAVFSGESNAAAVLTSTSTKQKAKVIQAKTPKSKPRTEKAVVTPQSTVPMARDPQIAVQEEFDAARQRATIAAWDLFLARHGDNQLAASARVERSKIANTDNSVRK